MTSILAQVLFAYLTGSASIPVKIALVPYVVTVTHSGKAGLPNITHALKLSRMISAFLASGQAEATVTVGTDQYTLTLATVAR